MQFQAGSNIVIKILTILAIKHTIKIIQIIIVMLHCIIKSNKISAMLFKIFYSFFLKFPQAKQNPVIFDSNYF